MKSSLTDFCVKRSRCKAFTLVEVLVVITIMAIAAGVVAPRILATGTMGVQAASRMLIADLLYAQNEAMAQQKTIRVTFSVENNRYSINYVDGNSLHVAWKGGDAGTANHKMDFDEDERFRGVELKKAEFGGGLGSPVSYIEFDEMGTPSVGGVVEMYYAGDQQHYQIQVADFTGRINLVRL